MRSLVHSLLLAVIFTTGCLSTPTEPNLNGFKQGATISSTASPEHQQQGLEIVSAFEKWLVKHRVREGSIAVSHQGTQTVHKGFGRSSTKAFPVASLSKSITAVCLQTLLDQQDKQVTLTLSDTIPKLLQQYPPVDERLASVTLAQLISHNSGIHSRYHRNFIANRNIFNRPAMREQFRTLVGYKLTAEPGSGYNYNNANYLLLGLAIEELSGGSYEQICQKLVLEPIGINAALTPRWRVMSSWGGWEISSVDYLKFLNTYFANNQVMGRAPKSLGINAPVKRGAHYNLGVLTRTANGGNRFWHSGSWRWQGNQRRDEFGAWFVILEDGLVVSVNYSSHATQEKLWDLEKRLFEAFRQ